MLKIASNQHKM